MLLIPLGATKFAFILHQDFGFTWPIAVADTLATSVVMALSVWSIILLVKSYPTKVTVYSYAMLIAIVLAVGSTYSIFYGLKWWFKGVECSPYLIWLQATLPVRLALIGLFYCWMATNSALRKNINELDTRFQVQTDAATLLRDAELFKLRQQLQPHFLYNSLNSISALIMISPDRAQEMIGKLSDFLRGSVKREAEDKILVTEELVYIESYLAIESVRFGHRLKVDFEKEFAPEATIPPFLFQPILENAIKFGLYGKTGAVTISISIHTHDNVLILKIVNPFDPYTEPPRGTGFGLEGVGRRLYLLYARTDLIETHKDEEQFTTILKIPQNYV